MKKFNYHFPNNLEDGYKIFKSSEFPQYLAGGMTILPSIKQGLSFPSDLIDISNFKEIKGIKESNNNIVIGSLTTHNEVAKSDFIKKEIPGLAFLASKIADNAIRNSGTIGGSICNADPAADYPAALVSLKALLVTNLRKIDSRDFFIDMFETALQEGEIVKYVIFPKKKSSFYEKFSSQASKYAIVGAFLTESTGLISVAITGASNKVFIIQELESLSINEAINFDLNKINFSRYNINSDLNGSVEYRISLIKNLTSKLILKIKK